MENISTQELIELLREDRKFIAFAITPWHANSIEASMLKYLPRDSHQGIILCEHVGVNTRIINEKDFPVLTSKQVVYYDYQTREFKSILKKIQYVLLAISILFKRKGKNKIYIFSTKDIAAYHIMLILKNIKNADIINVICDEGLGTYEENRKGIKGKISKIILKVIENKITIIRDTLFFDLKSNQLELNKDICKRYPLVFKQYKIDLRNIHPLFRNIDKYLVLCLAPMKEIKEVSDKLLNTILMELKRLSEENHFLVFVKLHPRENDKEIYSEYGFPTVGSNSSMEVLLANLEKKPHAIIGSYSTSLVTANLFWKIPSVSFLKFADKSELCALENTSGFIKKYQRYIYFPNNLKEFREKIVECINEHDFY